MTRMLAAGIVVLLTVCGMSAVAPQTVAPLPVHQRVAVLVGVDRYQDRAIGRDLSGCRNDAVEMAEILRRKYRFAPATLIDHEATKKAVMDALRRAAEKAGPGDQVLFFFSGYGSVDGNGKPALCPYDALAAGADNDVWAGELWSWVNSVGRKGASPLLVLDCAFLQPTAIAMGPRIRPKCLIRPQAPGPGGTDSVESALTNIATSTDRGVVIAACRPGELARETDRGGDNWIGVFSRFLIEQLGSLAHGETISFKQLRDALLSKISTYISDVYYGDSYVQTPRLYGRSEYLANTALFSSGEAAAPTPRSNELRLRVVYWGGEERDGQEFRDRFARMPHVQLVEKDDSADQSLYVFRTKAEVKAYLVDYRGKTIQSDFSAPPTDPDAFLHDINARISGLIAYRWLGSLPAGDPSFGLNLWLTDSGGEVVRQVAAGDWVTVNLEANRECYVTVYSVTPNFDCERVLPGPGHPQDSYRLSAGEHWSKRVSPSQPARYRLVAVAKEQLAQPSSRILLSFWSPAVQEYVRAAEAVAMGREGGAPGTTPPGASDQPMILPLRPSFGGATEMGATAEGAGYATDVEDLTVTEVAG